MPPKELVPVLPEWCDCTYRNRCPRKSCIFLGTVRIILAIISFTYFTILASKPYFIYDHFKAATYNVQFVRGISITICLINVCHLAAAIYLIYLVKSNTNNTPKIRRWLIVDMGITGCFVLCVLIILFALPPHRLYLILGFKLIFLGLLFCYRNGVAYHVFRTYETERMMVHVASPDGAAPESHYENVYRV